MNAIRKFIAKYPIIVTVASAVAGYFGGPTGVSWLQKLLAAIGIGG